MNPCRLGMILCGKKSINDENGSLYEMELESSLIYQRERNPWGPNGFSKETIIWVDLYMLIKQYWLLKDTNKDITDYFDACAPVTRTSSIRILISISAFTWLYIHQIDVKEPFSMAISMYKFIWGNLKVL